MADKIIAGVYSGGGSKGAFQVGATCYTMQKKGRDYDWFFGTSVGAINGSGLAQFEKGQQDEAAEYLKEMWTGLKQSDVAKKRFLSPLSLAWSPSTQDTAALRAYLDARIVTPLKRHFCCVAVDLVSGERRTWTHENDRNDLLNGIMASSAAPILYPPVWEGKDCLLVDGGVVDVSMLEQAIRLGADEIDVYLTEAPKLDRWEPKSDRVWHTAPRVLELMLHEIVEDDIKKTRLYNRMVEGGIENDKRVVKVNVIRPETPLPIDSAEFGHDLIMECIQIGYDSAKAFWESQEG